MIAEYKREIIPEWLHHAHAFYLDGLNDGEVGYIIGWCFVQLEDKAIVVPQDQVTLHGALGTFDVKVKRTGDTIEIMTNNFNPYTEQWRLKKVLDGQPTFPVRFTDNG